MKFFSSELEQETSVPRPHFSFMDLRLHHLVRLYQTARDIHILRDRFFGQPLSHFLPLLMKVMETRKQRRGTNPDEQRSNVLSWNPLPRLQQISQSDTIHVDYAAYVPEDDKEFLNLKQEFDAITLAGLFSRFTRVPEKDLFGNPIPDEIRHKGEELIDPHQPWLGIKYYLPAVQAVLMEWGNFISLHRQMERIRETWP